MRALVLTILFVAGCLGGSTFEAAKWRDADLTGRTRADMLPDFIKRYGLKGMARQQVVALLGPPTATDKWRGTDMIYVLGNDGSIFGIDNEWLLISMDRHDRVSSYRRTVD